jgi:hypothetical protein
MLDLINIKNAKVYPMLIFIAYLIFFTRLFALLLAFAIYIYKISEYDDIRFLYIKNYSAARFYHPHLQIAENIVDNTLSMRLRKHSTYFLCFPFISLIMVYYNWMSFWNIMVYFGYIIVVNKGIDYIIMKFKIFFDKNEEKVKLEAMNKITTFMR